MPTLVDVRTPIPRDLPAGLVQGYAGAVIEVAYSGVSRGFYRDLLGFADAGDAPEGPRLRLGTATLVLRERESPRVLPEGGAHWAYRLPRAALAATLVRLEAAGVAVERYREDRAAEEDANRYCADPDGNRIQLVEGAPAGIDHVGIETHDMEWAEIYWTQVLGARVEGRVGWHMDDYERAIAWAEGGDERAPGTRRWDKRYTTIEGQARLPRPNVQTFVTLAEGVTVAIFLATEHHQEPPREQWRGTPRIVFAATPQGLAEIGRLLREVHVRCLAVSEFGGPFVRADDTIFARDTGGNFLEFGIDTTV